MIYSKEKLIQIAVVAPVSLAALATRVLAVDPDLATVSGSMAQTVGAILVFIVAVVGAFITAALVPMGFKKLWAYIKKLLHLA